MRTLPKLPAGFVTRFAPSPTGLLHLGHALNAAWVWGVSREAKGSVILRIEDHDRGRCRRAYESAILDDLEWLGLVPDRPALSEFRSGERSDYRQSDCAADYEAALARLRERAQVYACRCSRKEILARTGRPGEELWYDGHCRGLGHAFEDDLGIRVALPGEALTFEDALLGSQTQRPAEQCGDLLLRDRHGNWTYQFCVVVDDLRHGVNLVVRGQDLLESTGRQMQLRRLLGCEADPVYLHHPLICDEATGEKLSKRDGAASLRELRAAGVDVWELLEMSRGGI